MSNNDQEEIETFVKNVKEFLLNDDPDSAMHLFTLDDEIIEDSAWDIIPIVSDYLTSFNANYRKKLFEGCEFILNKIAETCNPCETILQCLEQIEFIEDDTKFFTLLKPVGISFNKVNDKFKVIEWCVSTIKLYVQDLPIPIYNNPESNKNKNNEEICPVTNRIINVYFHVISFIQSIVTESNLKNVAHQDIIFKNYVAGLLISLLGSPFCYLHEDLILETQIEFLRNEILILVFNLIKDPLYFLKFMKDRLVIDTETLFKNDLEEITPSVNRRLGKLETLESEEIVPTLAYANFYFYVITKETLWVKLPQVYHPYYIFQACIFLAGSLIDKHHIDLINKGFTFIEVLLKRLEKMSICPNALELEVYTNLLDKIVKVMVYCESNNERKKASLIFQKYILNAFNMEARYFIILHLYYRSHHSGVLSLVTGLVKTSIIESLETMPRYTYFFGNNLESLLKHSCNLAHGSATDLIEISDEIIAGLNLLRFLFIRDRSNETGIWNLIHMLENNYLKPLRQGIDLSKAHWKTKIKDLEEAKNNNKSHSSSETEAANVILTVGNQKLPAMPIEQKLEISHQILCSLDVMESLLIRVDECIVNNPIKRLRSLLNSRVLLRYRSNDTTDHQKEEQNESSNKETEEEYEKKTKKKILTASMNFVPELGWSRQAISAGAESIGYPGVIHGMFPNGGAELVAHFYSTCNSELNNILKEKYETIQADVKKVEDKSKQVCYAVETRLRMIIPYKKNWPQAIALMTLPSNVPTALANLVTLVDDICYYTGDRSVDINWYTKRVVLAGIYKTTELYMLQDNSEDHKQTWNFLKRRLEDASQLHRIIFATSDLQQPEQTLKQAKEIANATIITARNILGLN